MGKLDEAGNPSQSDPIGSLKTGALIPDAEKRPWAKIMQIIGALSFAQSIPRDSLREIDASGWLETGQESRLERTQINPCDTNRIRGDLLRPFQLQ